MPERASPRCSGGNRDDRWTAAPPSAWQALGCGTGRDLRGAEETVGGHQEAEGERDQRVVSPAARAIGVCPRFARLQPFSRRFQSKRGSATLGNEAARTGWRPDAPFTNQDALRVVAREPELNFEPGEQFAYSNTGYTLLAVIVERAARVPLDQFAETRIFSPLNMKNTHFHADATRLVRRRAYAYEPSPSGGLRLAPPVPTRVGAGGIFTTVEDLARWDQNFYDGRVGGESLIRQITIPGTLSSGRQVEYAFGLEVRDYRGLRVVEHGGSLVGYQAYLARFPSQRFSVICLCNLSNIRPDRLAHAVADIYLHL